MKNWRFLVGFLMVVVVPVICYFVVVEKGGNGRIKLPKFYGGYTKIGTKKVRGKTVPDTIWHVVPNIILQNQLGKQIDIDSELKGKIVVMNFFKTSDSNSKINSNLKFLQDRYKKADSLLHFVSITTSPTLDSFAQLRKYANKLAANHDKWWFCRTSEDATKKYITQDLKLDLYNENAFKQLMNTEKDKWILLDRERNIRGYYSALDTNEIRRCADDISLLILEKKTARSTNLLAIFAGIIGLVIILSLLFRKK
jgi:protein SCO1